ncbi:hypothetical protein CesoFtcFv8_008299 [Champsocephalus esox]|uniref:Uncharacterized protein n=1 Tax=Champsocephalus esox TaxID=159716 RepID=A0AAN8C7C5_9TELE|nr:hypothetical protein CesoFtcFv8_008299 [Champsocephalus esox]
MVSHVELPAFNGSATSNMDAANCLLGLLVCSSLTRFLPLQSFLLLSITILDEYERDREMRTETQRESFSASLLF